MKRSHLRFISIAAVLAAAPLLCAQATAPAIPPPAKEAYLKIAAEVEKSLLKDDFAKFFPAAMDEKGGGFFEMFGEDWTHTGPRGQGPAGDTTRSVVYQSRLTWMAAQASLHYPDKAADYLKFATAGAKFLEEKQWDPKAGGFWWSVDTTGKSVSAGSKHTYGNSFAIFALATYAKASKPSKASILGGLDAEEIAQDKALRDSLDALDAAKKGFTWLEDHAHDAANGGYFEQIQADGTQMPTPANGRGTDVVGAVIGQKSMNTHIHLLEAFTALLEVDPDPLLKKRTEELYQILLTKVIADPGYQHMFFQPDWTPVVGRDSYGHDIETAFLLTEAAAALGKPDDAICWETGRKIVDHCLNVAFDPNGALNNEGTVDGTGNIDHAKVWWVQAEALNALLLMHERYGKDDPKYWTAFVKEWNFIEANQIDHKNGGWYNTLNPDNTPLRSKIAKTDAWTEGYHQGRAMLNVSERLNKLAAVK